MLRDTSVFPDNKWPLLPVTIFWRWTGLAPENAGSLIALSGSIYIYIYIYRRGISGRMKYDKIYPPLPATLTLSHSLSNVFRLFSCFATEISEVPGAISTRNRTGTAEKPRQSPIVNGPDVGTFIVKNAVYVRHTGVHIMLGRQIFQKRIRIIASRLNNFQHNIRIFLRKSEHIRWLIYPIQ